MNPGNLEPGEPVIFGVYFDSCQGLDKEIPGPLSVNRRDGLVGAGSLEKHTMLDLLEPNR